MGNFIAGIAWTAALFGAATIGSLFVVSALDYRARIRQHRIEVEARRLARADFARIARVNRYRELGTERRF